MKIRTKLIVLFLTLSLLPMGFIAFYSTSKAGKSLETNAKMYLEAKSG